MTLNTRQLLEAVYPEAHAGGYTRQDGTVEFFSRVNALLSPKMKTLDFGAGRGAWVTQDPCALRRQLRRIQGKVQHHVAADVDPVSKENPTADETVVLQPGAPLPFNEQEFDLILSDFVFEHIPTPRETVSELTRILKPGGWICARTPLAYSYSSLITRLISNRLHTRILNRVQPERLDHDVFPTTFLLNTKRSIRRYFPAAAYDNYCYTFVTEPAYHFNKVAMLRLMDLGHRLLPRWLVGTLMIFLRKH